MFDGQVLACTARATSNRLSRIQRTPCAGIAIWPVREFTDPCARIQGTPGVHDGRETKLRDANPSWEEGGNQPGNSGW